jgi:hypothetical protein
MRTIRPGGPLARTRSRRRTAIILLIVLLICVTAWSSIRPRTDRVWSPDMAKLPSARFDGDSVHVRNVRYAIYQTTDSYTVAWEDRSYDLRRLESVWYMVEPFAEMKGPAHTLVSFGFAGDEYLAISVELRREPGEHFSPIRGLLRQFELMYVVGDERDLLKLRTNFRRDSVYLYPVRATPAQRRTLLVSMLERANKLEVEPEFYNTLTNTCTTNIVRHVNEIAPGKVPFSYKVLLPGYSDQLAYDLGLLDTDLPFAAARERYRINERALRYADSAEFSRLIRDPE